MDASEGMLARARERLAERENVEWKVLDITRETLEAGGK